MGSLQTQIDTRGSITYHLFGLPFVVRTRSLQIKEIQQMTAGPLRAGATYIQVSTLPSGASSETIIQITEYNPSTTIVAQISGGVFPPSEIGIVLAPITNDSKLTVTLKVQLKGFFKLFGLFLASIIKRQAEINMDRMKERIESLP